MSLLSISPKQFHGAVLLGCQSVIAQRENLNRINVFPVADGDTGDNMASTATAILSYSKATDSLIETLQSIADASVMGARGNSGMIFSQFFNALTEKSLTVEQLDLSTFCMLLDHAALSVRESLSNPIDGTILTQIEGWAKIFKQESQTISCINQAMQEALPELKAVVDDTTHHLAVLEKAHVVDAGALGFYYFTEGFARFVADPQQVIVWEPEIVFSEAEHEIPTAESVPELRYCTEAIIRAESIDKSSLAKELEHHGDSVVISGNQRVCRFHVHTNKPWNIFQNLLEKGTIESPKVDDMCRQFEVLHQRKNTIALVTDSSADIPAALRDKYQIHMIPLNMHLDKHQLLDRYCFEADSFYGTLQNLKSYPKTSFPTPVFIQEKLRHLSLHYDDVLVISVAKVLSGTHDAFVKAASPFKNIQVIDSKAGSGAQGLLIQYAAELIEKGKTAQEIKKAVEDARDSTYLFGMVNQFESLIRSGRVSKLMGRIANFSQIKPIISFDKSGKGIICGRAFNSVKALGKIVSITEKIQQEAQKTLQSYCVIHAGVPEEAKEFAKLTTEAFGQAPSYIESVSSVIGLHAGQGCVGLAFILSQE